MERALGRIHDAGLGVAAISYDSVEVLKQFSQRSGITFPLLSDSDSAVIRRYGIRNETIDKGTPFYGIPHPGTYLVDHAGVVTAKFFEEDYRVRDTAASIVLRQFGITAEKHEMASGKHVTILTSASDAEARPGQRITLTLDVRPGKRIHVYAPGVQGYKPVEFYLDATKSLTADAPVFPASQTMNLTAIRETAPVYSAPFRIQQTLTLAGANTLEPMLDKDRNLQITGQFRYQACDDKECFLPETLRAQWSVHVLPLDRTRVSEDARRK